MSQQQQKTKKQREEEEIQKEIDRAFTNITPDGGVRKFIAQQGDGRIPANGEQVAVHMNATLEDGTVVYDSFEKKIPLKLTIGGEASIPGVELAAASMRFGEKIRLEVSPKYAFGAMDNTHGFHGYGVRIPPNSKLIFEMHLLPLDLALPKTTMQWVETAEANKLSGNKAFEAGDNEMARTEYDNALKIVDRVKKQLEVAPTNLEGKTEEEIQKLEKEREESKNKMNNLYVSIHTNLAAVDLKLKRYDDAKDHCRRAIEVDPKNVKAYFRLAMAHKEIDQFESAIEVLKNANEIQSSANIIKELAACKRLNEEKLKREKASYSNMFSKLSKEEGLYEGVEPGKRGTWKCYYCGEEMDEIQRARHIIKNHSGEKKKEKWSNKNYGLPDQIPLDISAKPV